MIQLLGKVNSLFNDEGHDEQALEDLFEQVAEQSNIDNDVGQLSIVDAFVPDGHLSVARRFFLA